MVNLNIHGKPVFPMMIRNAPNNRGTTAYSKDIIESGVRVNPRSLNIEAGVKKPLVNQVSLNSIKHAKADGYVPPHARLAVAVHDRAPCLSSNNPGKQNYHAEQVPSEKVHYNDRYISTRRLSAK